MTKQDKRDRRQARHELAKQLRRQVMRRNGLYSTPGQLHAAMKVAVDRAIAAEMKQPESGVRCG